MIAPARERRGTALLMVILILSVLALIFAGVAKLGLAERNQARSEERRLRASWLAESGLERARAKLSADRGYRGETWSLPAEMLGGPHPAIVLIRVEDRSGALSVSSRADYPSEGPARARVSRSAILPLPVTPDAPER